MEENLIIEVWDVFKEYIPEKNKNTAANHFVDFLTGKEVKNSVLEGLVGYDPHLDDAIESVIGEAKDDEDSEADDWSYDDDED